MDAALFPSPREVMQGWPALNILRFRGTKKKTRLMTGDVNGCHPTSCITGCTGHRMGPLIQLNMPTSTSSPSQPPHPYSTLQFPRTLNFPF